MGAKNFFGSPLFNVPKPSAEDEQKQIEWAESDKRIKNILIEHSDNTPKKLLGLIKEVHKNIDTDVEFAINNLEDNQKTIDKIVKDVAKSFPKDKGSGGLKTIIETEKAIKVSESVINISSTLSLYAQTVDILIHHNAPDEYKDSHTKNVFRLVSPLNPPATKETPKSKDGDLLRELAKNLQIKGEEIYNNRKIIDDDKNATSRTFLYMKRIRDFLHTLPNDSARLTYLKKMKRAYVEKDERAFLLRDSGKFFAPRPTVMYKGTRRIREEFFDALQSEIDFYSDICKSENLPYDSTAFSETLTVANSHNTKKNTDSSGTLRQKVLILLTLMYGKPEIPGETVLAEVVRLIQFLIGGNYDNLEKYVGNPTSTSSDSIKSKQNRVKDLEKIIELVKNVNVPAALSALENERKELIEDIKDLQSEKNIKKNNR